MLTSSFFSFHFPFKIIDDSHSRGQRMTGTNADKQKMKKHADEMKKKKERGVGVFPDIKAGREELLPDDNVQMWRNSFLETDGHLILGGCIDWP